MLEAADGRERWSAARIWVSSAAAWEAIPDDGLPRFAEGFPARG